jgi:hypothetical protein
MPDIETIQMYIAPVLQELAQQLDVTSVWLCRFDFAKNHSVVVGEHIGAAATALEENSDLGEIYPEFSTVWRDWLRNTGGMKIAHTDEMNHNDADWIDYVENSVQSVAYYPVKVSGIAWGFVEVWESHGKRSFDTPAEEAILRRYAIKVGAALNQLISAAA